MQKNPTLKRRNNFKIGKDALKVADRSRFRNGALDFAENQQRQKQFEITKHTFVTFEC